MPLDKVLISHLEDQDVLEEQIDQDIEALVSKLSISEIMSNPDEALVGLAERLQQILKESYYKEASKNGIELAKNIEKDGDIQIPKSSDPNLNEGVIDES